MELRHVGIRRREGRPDAMGRADRSLGGLRRIPPQLAVQAVSAACYKSLSPPADFCLILISPRSRSRK
jgi:hypothetical protein